MTSSPASSPLPVRFGDDGLVPVVVQDADSGAVLMVAFMNEAALIATRETGQAHYWSRGRQKLWRKGESSGHVQLVDDIYVNCEQNSLLLSVRQAGTVCHDGYDTCFYRRLEPDGQLTTVRERSFDPSSVYGPRARDDTLASLARIHYDAFAYLRDQDLTHVSRTSAQLRASTANLHPRIAGELRELAGVLDGTHAHTDFHSDLLLEGSQVLYWVILAALRAGWTWDDLRLDRALATQTDELDRGTAAALLNAESERWQVAPSGKTHSAPELHATIALVGQALRIGGIPAAELIEFDLAALREKPYLAPFFTNAADQPASAN